MILQVNQATANGRNQFEILENGQLFQLFSASLGKSVRYSDPEYFVGKISENRSGVSVFQLLQVEADLLRKKVSGLSESGQNNASSYTFYRSVLTEMEMMLQDDYSK